MAEFLINIESMNRSIDDITEMMSELSSIQAELESVNLSSLSSSSLYSIESSLNEQKIELNKAIESVKGLVDALKIIVRNYTTTEDSVQKSLHNNKRDTLYNDSNCNHRLIKSSSNAINSFGVSFSNINLANGYSASLTNCGFEINSGELFDTSVFGDDNCFVYTTSDGTPWIFHQGIQEPIRPSFDKGYPYDPDMEATWSDRLNWIKWGFISGGADLIDYIPDAVEAYNHYRNGDGSDLEINLYKAYNQDPSIKQNTDNAVAETNRAVQQMIANGAQPPFTITSECKSAGMYPETENWQKAVGGYQTWVSAEVSYDDQGNIVVVTTVNEWDRYNFDKGKVDITTHEPDDVNGRFEALGWAHSFDTYGSVTFETTFDLSGEIGVPEISATDRGNRAGYERRKGR